MLHTVAVAGVLLSLLAMWHAVKTRSRLLGHLLLAGLVVRATAGVTLFVLSYWDLPILASLHTGNGFWVFASDAQNYYLNARDVLERGLAHASDYGLPTYVALLAVWMRIVGASPLSGMLLNLLTFGLLSYVAVRFYRPTGLLRDDLPCAVVLGSFGLLPSIVAHSTQSLADDFVIAAAWVALMSAAAVFAAPPGWRALRTCVPAAVASGAALLFLTGLRSYFALMTVACLLPGAAVRLWIGRRALLATTVACLVFVLSSWSGYKTGEDPYWNPMSQPAVPVTPAGGSDSLSARVLFQRIGVRIEQISAIAGQRLRESRLGFIYSRGDTNVASVTDPGNFTHRAWDESRALLLGYGLIFVPIKLLKSEGLVHFSGGRGMLGIADVDTLLMDAVIATVAVLSWRKRQLVRANLAFFATAAGLFGLAATLLAYTVTNYGTLFRLRAMILVPVWVLALALRPTWPAVALNARR